MLFHIRRAVFESDRAALTELFRRYLAPEADDRRFNWLYRACPCGQARAWVACDDASGSVIGAAAAFPRRFYFDGREQMGWVLGDFCVEERSRSLGPALQLQRACMEAVAPPFLFCYDFPSRGMMAIYKRLGIPQTGALVRWAKPLRCERKLESFLHSKKLARGIGAIVNFGLARQGWKGEKSACDLELLHGTCGEEFTLFDKIVNGRRGVSTVRPAEYLNWRYLSHPTVTHQILTARRGGKLAGYAVLAEAGENGTITDLCAVEESSVIGNLLGGVVEFFRQRGAGTVSLNAGFSHPWNSLFQKAGFHRREEVPVVAFIHPQAEPIKTSLRDRWFLMQGERDS